MPSRSQSTASLPLRTASRSGIADLLALGPFAKAEQARRSLLEFIRQAWPIVEPGRVFVETWHVRGICRHLEGVAEGRIHDLLINVPPGCMKSLLCSVFWPSWVWITRPRTRWLFASYSQELSGRDSLSRRKIIASDWYRRSFGTTLTGDENRKIRFHNSAGGWMLATSVGGQGTGEHPDFVVIDDPHNAQQAESEIERDSVVNWWDNTIVSRGVVRDVRRVVAMQRLHRLDLSNHLLHTGRFEHLCLPMEYEGPSRMPQTSLGWIDERTILGSPLCPELLPSAALEQLKSSMTLQRQAAQLQQRPPLHDPSAEFPASYFGPSIWFADWPTAEQEAGRVMSLDPSLGLGELCDDSALVMMLVDTSGTCWIDADLARRDATSLVMQAAALAEGFRPTHFGLETNGFQDLLVRPLLERLEAHGVSLRIIRLINTEPKLIRIRRLSQPLSLGRFRFRDTPSTRKLVEQLRAFPSSRHDDGPDALEGALRTWRACLREREEGEA